MRRTVSALLAACFCGCLMAQPAFREVRRESVAAGAPVVLAAPVKLPVAHASFLLEAGEALPVLVGGQPQGFYFHGRGVMTYRSVEPSEAANLRYNVQHNTSWKWAYEDGVYEFTQPFEDLVFWMPAGKVPGFGEAAGAERLSQGFAKLAADMPDFVWTEWLHQALAAAGNAGRSRYAAAFLRGQGRTWMYEHDGPYTRMESLSYLRPNRNILAKDLVAKLWVPLSQQPIGWERRRPLLAPLKLVDLDARIQASAGLRVQVSTRQTFVANLPGQRVLRFHLAHRRLWANHLGVVEAGLYSVKRVRGPEGQELPFNQGEGSLVVQLPAPTRAGEKLVLAFDLEGDLLAHPGGDRYWSLVGLEWFPCLGDGAEAYRVHAVIQSPRPYLPVAGGDTVRRWEEGDQLGLEVRIDKPVRFFGVVGGAYTQRERSVDGRTVRLSCYGQEAPNADRVINAVFGLMACYDRMLGPYPFKEMNIIQINDLGFGVAPPGAVLITNEAFASAGSSYEHFMRQYFSKGVNQRLAHELAHQYWGQVVKRPTFEERWLEEGFAQYCSVLALESIRGYGKPAKDAVLHEWRRKAEDAAKQDTIPFADWAVRLDDPGAARLLSFDLLYCKSPLVLERIHREVGDAAFLQALQAYLRIADWEPISTEDFGKVLTRITGKDWQPSLNAWFWGEDLP